MMDSSEDPSRRVHIAIVRFTSLGDVIHALPMAAAIRRHRPQARITWLIEEREQILLRDNPVVDESVIVPLRRWRDSLSSPGRLLQSMSEVKRLARHLREASIDVAIDVQGWAHKTSPFMLLTRAPVRIGFDRAHARDPFSPLATNRHVTPPATAQHIVDQNLALLEPLGISATGPAEFPLPAFAEAEARAAAWRAAHGLTPDRRIVVLLPSTRGEAKRWPAGSYRELSRRLLADENVCVVVLGGPGEEPILDAVREGLPTQRSLAWAPGPIPDLVAMLRHPHLVIGNDTGPLHVAAARGVPSLGLFGPTQGARNGPYGPHGAFLQSPTGRMSDLGVDEVFAAAQRLSFAQ
jgi:lipopolysaccharide heptosyltransferase I